MNCAGRTPGCQQFVNELLVCVPPRAFEALVASGEIAGLDGFGVRKGMDTHVAALSSRKLQMLDDADALQDLKAPPGNRLEALKGNRKGQHSIRVNDQWRICFVWTEAGPERVEIVDYH